MTRTDTLLKMLHRARLLTREVDRLAVDCFEIENVHKLAQVQKRRTRTYEKIDTIRKSLSFDRAMAIIKTFNAECDELDAQDNKYGLRYRIELEIEAGNLVATTQANVYRVIAPVKGPASDVYLYEVLDSLVVQGMADSCEVKIVGNGTSRSYMDVYIEEPIASKINQALEIAASDKGAN